MLTLQLKLSTAGNFLSGLIPPCQSTVMHRGELLICHLLMIAGCQLVRGSTDTSKENLGSFPLDETDKKKKDAICIHKWLQMQRSHWIRQNVAFWPFRGCSPSCFGCGSSIRVINDSKKDKVISSHQSLSSPITSGNPNGKKLLRGPAGHYNSLRCWQTRGGVGSIFDQCLLLTLNMDPRKTK